SWLPRCLSHVLPPVELLTNTRSPEAVYVPLADCSLPSFVFHCADHVWSGLNCTVASVRAAAIPPASSQASPFQVPTRSVVAMEGEAAGVVSLVRACRAHPTATVKTVAAMTSVAEIHCVMVSTSP